MSNFIEEYIQETKLNKEELEETKNKIYLIKESSLNTAKDASCNLIYDNAVLAKTCELIGNVVIENYDTIEKQEQIIEHKNTQINDLGNLIGKSNKDVLKITTKILTFKESPKSKHLEKFRKAFIKEVNRSNEINKKLGYN